MLIEASGHAVGFDVIKLDIAPMVADSKYEAKAWRCVQRDDYLMRTTLRRVVRSKIGRQTPQEPRWVLL